MTLEELILAVHNSISISKTDYALDLMQKYAEEHNDDDLLKNTTMLQAKLTKANDDFLIKQITNKEEYDIAIGQVNYAVLELMDRLDIHKNDNPPPRRDGKLLHNVPGKMPIDVETKCIIRIAYTEEQAKKNLQITPDTVVQDVRITEVMAVELIDTAETPNFKIRPFDEEEQFVAEDSYTQWMFFVKPLHEGTFPLTIKVAVIEEINGKERRRNIVLEKQVEIVAFPDPHAPGKSDQSWEDTQVIINYVEERDEQAGDLPSEENPNRKRSIVGTIAAIAGTIVMAFIGTVYYLNNTSNYKDLNKDVASQDTTQNKSGEQDSGTYAIHEKKDTILQNEIYPDTAGALAGDNPDEGDNTDRIAKSNGDEDPAHSDPSSVDKTSTSGDSKTKGNTKPVPSKTGKNGSKNKKDPGSKNNKPDKKKAITGKPAATPTPKTNPIDIVKPPPPPPRKFAVHILLSKTMRDANIFIDGKPALVLSKNKKEIIVQVEEKMSSTQIKIQKNGLICFINTVINSDNMNVEGCSVKEVY